MTLPNRRFRPEPMTAIEAIEWLKTHRYIWYQAPMDMGPRRVDLTSKLKLWKRSPERFSVSGDLMNGYNERFTIDNEHLDRLRMPFALWHHGITSNVSHVRYQDLPGKHIVLHQSNGYHLPFDKLAYAINFARRTNMELTVRHGRKVRVLVPAHPPVSGERSL